MQKASTLGPHLLEEKNDTNVSQRGFSALDTMLPLLLTAVNDGRLTIEDLVKRLHYNPMKIFNLPAQPKTFVEVDMDEEWVMPSKPALSKAGLAGMRLKGAVRRVVLRGEDAYIDGKVALFHQSLVWSLISNLFRSFFLLDSASMYAMNTLLSAQYQNLLRRSTGCQTRQYSIRKCHQRFLCTFKA